MEFGESYNFTIIWSTAYKAMLTDWHKNERQSKVCLDEMTKRGLVTMQYNHINGGNFISLTKKGNRIRESGGWIEHLLKPNFWNITILNVTTVGASIATIVGVILAIILSSKADTVQKLEAENQQQKDIIRKYESQKDSLIHLLKNQRTDSLEKK